MRLADAPSWDAFARHFKKLHINIHTYIYGSKTHRRAKVKGDTFSYLQVLVGFQGPDGGVSEFDVK